MKTSRTGRLIGLVPGLIVLMSVPGVALAADETPIDITVAPSTLNLSYQGPCVTVHTNLAYTDEVEDNFDWCLNGVDATCIYSDSRGYLVAKFDVATIAAVVAPGDVTMTLTGENGIIAYEGRDEVRVIDVEAAKNGI